MKALLDLLGDGSVADDLLERALGGNKGSDSKASGGGLGGLLGGLLGNRG